MMLDVKEVAKLLTVSEKTVYRWIGKNEIPAYKIGENYRFNRVELLEWATAHRIKVSYRIFDEALETGGTMPSLTDALATGGIHYRIPGIDKSSVLASIVDIIHLPEGIDKDSCWGRSSHGKIWGQRRSARESRFLTCEIRSFSM